MFKSALPLALATTPLLLAASQPPVLESIGTDCSLVEGSQAFDSQQQIAQPITSINQVIVNSQQELFLFSEDDESASLANGWGSALRLLLDNPYVASQDSAESVSSVLPLTSENRCISYNKADVESPLSVDLPLIKVTDSEGSVNEIGGELQKEAVGTSLSTPVPAQATSVIGQAVEPAESAGEDAVDETVDESASEAVDETGAVSDDNDSETEVDAADVEEDAEAESGEPASLPDLSIPTAPAGRTPVQSAEPTPVVEPAPSAEPTPVAEPAPLEEPAPTEAETDTDAVTPADVNSVPAPRMPAPAGVIPESPATENPNNFTPTGEEPTPFDGTVPVTLESLPDGNYRYLAGEAESRAYTTEELRQRGGSVFLLTKKEGVVTGDLLPRIGLPGICVTGAVSGNIIEGAAYPYDTTDTFQDSAREIGDTFEPHGSGALQIRQTRTTEGGGLYYAGARMDVSNFTIINAGTSLPPTTCTVGRTGGRDQ